MTFNEKVAECQRLMDVFGPGEPEIRQDDMRVFFGKGRAGAPIMIAVHLRESDWDIFLPLGDYENLGRIECRQEPPVFKEFDANRSIYTEEDWRKQLDAVNALAEQELTALSQQLTCAKAAVYITQGALKNAKNKGEQV
jgi:hypothetical protein